MFVSEKVQSPLLNPVLIIDKNGLIGFPLAESLASQFLPVLITSKPQATTKKIIRIDYKNKLPKIPDNQFSYIFLVLEGKMELLDFLNQFVKKAKESNGQLIVVCRLRQTKQKQLQKIQNLSPLIKIFLVGDIVDDELSDDNPVNYLLSQIKHYRQVKLANAGLSTIYPVLLNELISSIIKIVFVGDATTNVYLVFFKRGINELSLVRILKKSDPFLKLDFSTEKPKEEKPFIPGQATEVSISSLAQFVKQVEKTINFKEKKELNKKKIKPYKKAKRPILVWSLILAIGLLLLPLLSIFLTAWLSSNMLVACEKEIEKGEFEIAVRDSTFAQNMAALSAVSLNTLQPLLSILHQQSLATWLTNSLSKEQRLSEISQQISSGLLQVKNSWQNPSTSRTSFIQGENNLKNSLLQLQELQAERVLPAIIENKISDLEESLRLFLNTADSLPSILGFDHKRTYLLLFQNNMELRPGGGFIGSFGLVDLQNGRVTRLTIEDVYNADGQLKAQINPPSFMARYMGSQHLFLRDSNFDPDFSKDASLSAQILKDETGDKVDGVIGVDVEAFRLLLSAVGSIYLPAYNQTINSDNFYLLAQNHAEQNFFPGSSQKKDFLSEAYQSLLIRLREGNRLNYLKIMQAITSAILQKHVIFAFANPEEQNLFTINHLSSVPLLPTVDANNQIVDFLGVSESNLGANKANYYLKRQLSQQISIDNSGQVNEQLTINYQNSSDSKSAYGGDYKVYLRLLVPKDAQLNQVLIDGQKQILQTPSSKKTKTAGLTIDKTNENEHLDSWGIYTIVPKQQAKSLSFSYNLAQRVDLAQATFSYKQLLFKQAGALNDDFNLNLSYPASFRLLEPLNNFSVSDSKLVSSFSFNQDQLTIFNFSQK